MTEIKGLVGIESTLRAEWPKPWSRREDPCLTGNMLEILRLEKTGMGDLHRLTHPRVTPPRNEKSPSSAWLKRL